MTENSGAETTTTDLLYEAADLLGRAAGQLVAVRDYDSAASIASYAANVKGYADRMQRERPGSPPLC